MAPVLRLRLAAAKRICRSECSLFWGRGKRGRKRKRRGVHGGERGGAAAVSSALYLCVREGGGNMAAVMCMHAIEYDGVKEHT